MESQEIEITKSENVKNSRFAREVIGDTVHFGPGLAGSVSAQENLTFTQAGALIVRSENHLELMNGGAMALVSDGDCKITNGGAQVIIAGGGMELTNGGAQVIVVGGDLTAHKSFIGVAISPQIILGEGSRVLLDTPRAIAFGVAFGAVYGLVSWLLRRRSK